jgi:alpha-beta hydrolase superfamily lysophospholipase
MRYPALPAAGLLQDCGLRRTNARGIPQHGTAIDMPFDEQRLLETPSGAALNLFVKNACQKARAVVQINHGLSEHAGRYAAFADFLGDRGFHVYAQDHRGHGGTKAEDALPGMFARRDGVKKVVADTASVHDLIAREHPGLPVILFGRSAGGLIALSFLRERARPVAGAAIWNYPEISRLSAHAARLLLAWERFRLGSDTPSHLLPRFMADAGPTNPSRGWPPTISLWSDVLAMMAALSKPGAFAHISRDLPLHLVAGGGDSAALAERLRRTGFSNLVSGIYPENHDNWLNGSGGRQAMQDFAAWIDRRVLEA